MQMHYIHLCARVPGRMCSCTLCEWAVVCDVCAFFFPAEVLQDLFSCNDDVHVSFRFVPLLGGLSFLVAVRMLIARYRCFVAAVGSVNYPKT